MDDETLALLLLTGRIISVAGIVFVLKKQITVMRRKPDPALRSGRIVLLTLALVILVGNIIPIVLDILLLLGINRPAWVEISYKLDSNLVAVFSTGAIVALYVIAEKMLRAKEKK